MTRITITKQGDDWIGSDGYAAFILTFNEPLPTADMRKLDMQAADDWMSATVDHEAWCAHVLDQAEATASRDAAEVAKAKKAVADFVSGKKTTFVDPWETEMDIDLNNLLDNHARAFRDAEKSQRKRNDVDRHAAQVSHFVHR